MPGEKHALKFVGEGSLEAGEYQLALEIHSFENQPALKRTVNVQLAPQTDNDASVATTAN